ncbi:MAG: LysR substrate-binding domain-containing protein [Roseovarius sp.]|uniref:LysR substrate-binding domain-containing protein n=1 Tax=Roseovarius sp. TaxID=1486281 RepID=UPI0032EC0C83
MLNLNDLQIFVQVVDHGGFTAAGRALGLPKQTLSKRVIELERRAGVRLIQRTSRSFVVTELGSELYRHAAAMVIEAEAAENVILGRLAEPSGTVRVTASVPTVQTRLAPLLPRVATAYPKIRIVLHASDRFVDVVQEGYDIALRTHFDPLPDSELVQRRVSTEHFWLVASPSYLDGRKVDDPDQLSGLDGIFARQGQTDWTLTSAHGGQRSVTLAARYVANEGNAILAAAAAGLGVASLPSSMCEAQVASGALVRVAPAWTAGEIATTLIVPSRRGLLPSVRIVADLIAAQLRG